MAPAGQSSSTRLKFKDKLVGKGLSTDALLKKIKILHAELAALDQETVDTSSLDTFRKELVHTSIILHKDRGVKAYAACCLADILRCYAPDAPFTQSQLRDIFEFFFRELTAGLKGPDAPYYNQYFHLLECLATVKSVVLVCDLPNADELMGVIFRDFFALVRRDFTKKVELFMGDILIAIIDECNSLPADVLETLMAQFMDKNARLDQPAYSLAVRVCNETADKLQRHVSSYFTEIIVSNSEEEEFDQIRTAHDLIKRLHGSCPGLLLSVIPQLEEELHAESVTLRSIATQTLGEMFSEKGGAELVKNFPSAWNTWLVRKNDRSSVIRLKFVESSKGLYSSLPELRDVIEASYRAKLLDPDEKVRAAVCKVYSQLDYETALHHVSEEQIRGVAGRLADKKHIVRLDAAISLARLYSLAYPEIENNDAIAIEKFSWIANELLSTMSTIIDARAEIEQVLAEYILPLPVAPASSNSKTIEVDEVAWTDRVLNTMRYLDEKAVKALLSLTGIKVVRPTLYEVYVDACIQNNGGVIDENEDAVKKRLKNIIHHLGRSFPDPAEAIEELQAFADQNENRLYKLLKTCMDIDTDLKGLVKSTNEFMRRLEQSSSSFTSTMTIFLRRASLRLVNKSSIPTLLKRVQRGHGDSHTKTNLAAKHAQLLLNIISKHCPAMYKSCTQELHIALDDEKSEKLVSVALQALSGLIKHDESYALADGDVLDRVRERALGSQHRHAKFAARILAFSETKDEQCADVVETISEALGHVPPDQLVAHIAALAQFAKYATDVFEQKSDVITSFLLKKLLMVPSPASEGEDEEEWVEDEDLSDNARARILAVKLLRYRSMAHSSSEKPLEIATPVLKMLAVMLDNGGSLSSGVEEDPKVLSRMRLQAATSLLHLSTVETYANAIAPKFLRLTLTVQDTCFNVRMSFVTKLVALLQLRRLPPRYNVIPFLTAHDPEEDVKQLATSYVAASMTRMPPAHRVQVIELNFIRLLHILAHHPDFATTEPELLDIAKYVQFYLDLVLSSENLSLLYHLAAKGKTVRDAESQTYSENLYVMCELAQELIRSRAQHNSWNIPSYPGKLKLPSDILKPHPNAEVANKIVKQTYLPAEAVSWLASLSNPIKEKKERKVTTKRKATAVNTNGHTKRPRKKRRQSGNTDDDGSDQENTDVDMTDAHAHTSSAGEEDDPPGGKDRARNQAQARAKRHEARAKRAETPASGDA